MSEKRPKKVAAKSQKVTENSQKSRGACGRVCVRAGERACVRAGVRAGERAGVCAGERAGVRACVRACGVSFCEGALRGGMSLTFL